LGGHPGHQFRRTCRAIFIEVFITESVIAADLFNGHAILGLPAEPNDLLLAEPALFFKPVIAQSVGLPGIKIDMVAGVKVSTSLIKNAISWGHGLSRPAKLGSMNGK